jgi:hypothetical protein
VTVRASTPTVWSALRFRAKVRVLQAARAVRELRSGMRRFGKVDQRNGETLLAESVRPLWATAAGAVEPDRGLTLGKVHNLRLAVKHLDGALLPAHETFSFWKQLGRATRRRGYVAGRELREGCIVPSVGGGLCQLSNALYDAALRAGFEIVERHAHTAVVPGSLAEIGRDATVFWNYVDLRFRAGRDVRIEAVVSADSLVVRFWGSGGAPQTQSAMVDAIAPAPARPVPTGDCASCVAEQCFRHVALHRQAPDVGRTAFLLDAFWPEYDAYVGAVAARRDVVFLPIDGMRRGLQNYRWSTSQIGVVRESLMLTLLRSYRSRRLAQHGAERQRALLHWARRIGDDFAARLPYDVTHLVVMQHLLPALWSGGHLGGRTYDVLMTGTPMRALQHTLDAAFALHPESPTLNDFRADPGLVDAEERALAAARTIVTPHAAMTAQFGSRALRLPWTIPRPEKLPAGAPARDATVLFPAPTLGRAGAYELRDVARELGLHVVLTGPDLEGAGFWNGVSVERMAFADALRSAPVVVLPAFVEHQPRRLLLAAAMQLPVVASDACGLGETAGITTVPAGDVPALSAAIRSRIASRAFVSNRR